MIRNALIAFFTLISFSQPGFSQQIPVCGTSMEDISLLSERLLYNKSVAQTQIIQDRDGIQYVPVKFHLAADDDGSDRVLVARVLDQLCALNEDYADQNIQFFFKDGFNYINNTILNNDHIEVENSVMASNKVNNAINIFIIKDVNTSGDPDNSFVLGYYSIFHDWLVIRKDETNKFSTTLAHEMGHFFSLLHPHNGWECDPYDASKHGNPVDISKSPCTSLALPYAKPKIELGDKSNCENAGDFLCDTPPDYNFGFGWDDCNYNAGTKDPNGEVVDPEEKLFMGYFFGCSPDDYYFSTMQKEVITADLANPSRNHLHSSYEPNTSIIADDLPLLSPIGGVTTPTFTEVEFHWEALDGADAYLLEVDLLHTFNIQPKRFLVSSNSHIVEELEPDKKYFWRVRAFNEYYTCTNFTTPAFFYTDTATQVKDENELPSISLFPNPVQAGQNMKLATAASFPKETVFQLFDITGRFIKDLLPGSSYDPLIQQSIEFSLDIPGIYVLKIQVNDEEINKRIIVF